MSKIRLAAREYVWERMDRAHFDFLENIVLVLAALPQRWRPRAPKQVTGPNGPYYPIALRDE